MTAAAVGAACPLLFLVAALVLPLLLYRSRAMANTPCRKCRTPKPPRMYLCGTCWQALPAPTRCALNRRDSRAMFRLRELHKQIDAGVPLAEIGVTP